MNELTDKEIIEYLKSLRYTLCGNLPDEDDIDTNDICYLEWLALDKAITDLESRKIKRTVEEVREYCESRIRIQQSLYKTNTKQSLRYDELKKVIAFIDIPLKGDGK